MKRTRWGSIRSKPNPQFSQPERSLNMKAYSLCKLAVVIVVLLASVFVLRSQAAAPEVRKDVYDITTYVPFEIGATYLRSGDKITIEEVHGTADTISVGGLYEIKGTYTLVLLLQVRLRMRRGEAAGFVLQFSHGW